MQEIQSSNPPMVTGICDTNKSWVQHHHNIVIIFLWLVWEFDCYKSFIFSFHVYNYVHLVSVCIYVTFTYSWCLEINIFVNSTRYSVYIYISAIYLAKCIYPYTAETVWQVYSIFIVYYYIYYHTTATIFTGKVNNDDLKIL